MSDSEEELLLLCYLRNSLLADELRKKISKENKQKESVKEKIQKRKRESKAKNGRKRCWQNEDTEKCNIMYGTYSLEKQLCSDEERILRNLNIPAADFYEVLDLIKDDIRKGYTCFRKPISPEARLSVTLKYLNGKARFRDLAKSIAIGKSTIGKIIGKTCEAIYKRLQPIVKPKPSLEKLRESATKMKELTEFPNCVGVLDGKSLFIKKYSIPSEYRIRDKSPSILFALVDARYCFLAIKVLRSTQYDNQASPPAISDFIPEENMPVPSLLPEAGTFLPHVVIGNECFPLTKYVMTPYGVEDLLQDPDKGIYNKMHCQALNVVDYTFGLMAHKYNFFQATNTLNYARLEIVIKACCCLHNFMRLKDLSRNNGQVDENAVKEALRNSTIRHLEPYTGAQSVIGEKIRQNFSSYFSSSSNVAVKQENLD